MKKYCFLLIILFCFSTNGFATKKHLTNTKKPKNYNLINPKKENKILEIVFNTLKNKHLVEKKIDDNFSKKMFQIYLDSLDRNKLFLLQSDISEFKKYETKLDDQIKNNDLSFFFMTYDRLIMRMREAKEMYTNLLKNEYVFDKSTINNDLEILRFSKNIKKTKDEQKKQWIHFIKNYTVELSLIEIYSNPTLVNNVDDLKNLELITYSKIGNVLESSLNNFYNITRETILEYYINAIVIQYDPHSRYYCPYMRNRYLQNESGKLEGTGITVRQGLEFIEVKNCLTGGPADKTKKFQKDDVILKIGQGDEEPVNVVGYKIYDVAKLLKGKSGTIVKVTIKKPDGTIDVVSVKRAVVSSNDSYIKSCLVLKNKVKYGILSFPKFYNDFDDDQARNAVDDFELELQVLKESETQGIIIDLRDNSGGSVEAAIKILGNFIDKNPVIQLKNRAQNINILSTEPEKPVWKKPVVLIVNSETASAAEIFASAFKQFNIGVVIGQPTFGKGSIQEFLDLNTFVSTNPDKHDYGALKITTTKFYDITGKSIQKNGIVPDITFYEDQNAREQSLTNVLESDNVAVLKINSSTSQDYFSKIIARSKNRLSENVNLKNAIKNYQTQMVISQEFEQLNALNPEILAKQLSEIKSKQIELLKVEYKNNLDFFSTISDIKTLKQKPYLVQKRNSWLASLSKDYQIEEGLSILEELNILKN